MFFLFYNFNIYKILSKSTIFYFNKKESENSSFYIFIIFQVLIEFLAYIDIVGFNEI